MNDWVTCVRACGCVCVCASRCGFVRQWIKLSNRNCLKLSHSFNHRNCLRNDNKRCADVNAIEKENYKKKRTNNKLWEFISMWFRCMAATTTHIQCIFGVLDKRMNYKWFHFPDPFYTIVSVVLNGEYCTTRKSWLEWQWIWSDCVHVELLTGILLACVFDNASFSMSLLYFPADSTVSQWMVADRSHGKPWRCYGAQQPYWNWWTNHCFRRPLFAAPCFIYSIHPFLLIPKNAIRSVNGIREWNRLD